MLASPSSVIAEHLNKSEMHYTLHGIYHTNSRVIERRAIRYVKHLLRHLIPSVVICEHLRKDRANLGPQCSYLSRLRLMILRTVRCLRLWAILISPLLDIPEHLEEVRRTISSIILTSRGQC